METPMAKKRARIRDDFIDSCPLDFGWSFCAGLDMNRIAVYALWRGTHMRPIPKSYNHRGAERKQDRLPRLPRRHSTLVRRKDL